MKGCVGDGSEKHKREDRGLRWGRHERKVWELVGFTPSFLPLWGGDTAKRRRKECRISKQPMEKDEKLVKRLLQITYYFH